MLFLCINLHIFIKNADFVHFFLYLMRLLEYEEYLRVQPNGLFYQLRIKCRAGKNRQGALYRRTINHYRLFLCIDFFLPACWHPLFAVQPQRSRQHLLRRSAPKRLPLPQRSTQLWRRCCKSPIANRQMLRCLL